MNSEKRLLQKVKKEMKAQGYSDQKAADSVGVSRKTLNNAFNYKNSLSFGTFIKLCRFLGLDIEIRKIIQ